VRRATTVRERDRPGVVKECGRHVCEYALSRGAGC